MYTRQLLAIPLFIGVLGATSALPALAQDTNTATDRTVTTKVDNREASIGAGWVCSGLLG